MRALVPIERGAQIFCCYVDRKTAGKTNKQGREVADIDVLARGGWWGGANSRIHSPLLGDKVHRAVDFITQVRDYEYGLSSIESKKRGSLPFLVLWKILSGQIVFYSKSSLNSERDCNMPWGVKSSF